MQTSFFSCAQLAEGRTNLCATFQLSVGKSCDGVKSFSRLLSVKCPKCQAGEPHSRTPELSAAIDSMDCPDKTTVPASPAANLKPSPWTCNPGDLQKSTKAVARIPLTSPARISAKGAVQKPASPTPRHSPRRSIASTADMETVASMGASLACEPSLSSPDLADCSDEGIVDFFVDPVLEGL